MSMQVQSSSYMQGNPQIGPSGKALRPTVTIPGPGTGTHTPSTGHRAYRCHCPDMSLEPQAGTSV
eukprot:2286320-Rhodomonas_salina.1